MLYCRRGLRPRAFPRISEIGAAIGAVKKMLRLRREGSPLLVRRGGRDVKKMLRSLLGGAAGVVAFEPCFGMHCWKTVCATTPSAPNKELRGIFIYGAATPPREEGITLARNASTIFFTAIERAYSWEFIN